MKKYKIATNSLVFFEMGDEIQFDGEEHYRVEGDQTDRKIHKDVVENCPRWFKEITDEKY